MNAVKRFVLDTPVTVAWCFEDESTTFKERLLDLLSAGAEARAGHLAIRACKCIVGCGAT
jgi:hypothetical protein